MSINQEGFGLSYYWSPMIHVLFSLDLHGGESLPLHSYKYKSKVSRIITFELKVNYYESNFKKKKKNDYEFKNT